MTQRKIVLKQVKDHRASMTSRDLQEADEGDVVGSYEVVSVEEESCTHPQRRWKVTEQTSERPPKVKGTCTVCGDEKELYTTEDRPISRDHGQ